MLFLNNLWQPLFIVLAIRKMLYQNRIRLSIGKTNKYLTILNLLFIIFMLCVALLLKQSTHYFLYNNNQWNLFRRSFVICRFSI